MPNDDVTYQAPGLLIGGRWRRGGAATSNEVINPATEETLGILGHASESDLDAALEAADSGFRIWRRVPAQERAAILTSALAEIKARRERIATLITLEQGKPISQARGEVDVAIALMRWYAEQSSRVYGRIVPSAIRGRETQVRKEPLGPALLLTPWNMPVILTAWKIGGALAAGCSCIVKPAEETPAAVAELIDCFLAAGLPEGVLNLVYGVPAQVSAYLLRSDTIRKVSFTGSVPVGRLIARLASDGLKRVTLELGGHGPVVVMPDADLAAAMDSLVTARYRNAGQVCHAPTRFFVHEAVYDEFVAGFAERAAKLRVGDGLDPATEMGPLANARRLEAVSAAVRSTHGSGELVTGGKRLGERGFFYAPTVFQDVERTAPIMHEEPFGPVALMHRVSTLDQAIEHANATRYGLAAYIFTDSASTQRRLIDELQVGTVAVNSAIAAAAEAPFGGSRDSGYGYEGGQEGLEGFLHTKTVHQGS